MTDTDSHLPSRYDIAIIGGGPAGCSTALMLQKHAPELKVILIDAGSSNRFRPGESLAPPARAILKNLGVWEKIRDDGHCSAYSSAAAWGHQDSIENPYIFHAQPPALHLNRERFDQSLRDAFVENGGKLGSDWKVSQVRRKPDDGWEINIATPIKKTIESRFLVDASGSNARFARMAGAERVRYDRMSATYCVFDLKAGETSDITIEAFEHGWWYVSGIPDGRCIVVCMTDVDLVKDLKLQDTARWTELLKQTRHIQQRCDLASAKENLKTMPAASQLTRTGAANDYLAVGDAASSFDPLSGMGILKALRNGAFAAYSIADALSLADSRGLNQYRLLVENEYQAYSKTRQRYYQQEQRWPDSRFWNRRRDNQEISTSESSSITTQPVRRKPEMAL